MFLGVISESRVDVQIWKFHCFYWKMAENLTTLGLWLTDDIAYKFQFLEYTSVIHLKYEGFHRNRIIKKSWIGYFYLSTIQVIVGISIWMFKHN